MNRDMLKFDTKYNDVNTYMNQFYPMDSMSAPVNFHYADGEAVKEVMQPKHRMGEHELLDRYDKIDKEIILRVAMSKFLLADQLHQYLWLSGIRISSGDVCRRLRKLMVLRAISQIEVVDEQTEEVKLQCYKLAYWGNKFVYYSGMKLHKGIKYLPYPTARDLDKLDTPVDIKKTLNANQILLNMLKEKINLQKFGFMETLRPVSEVFDSYENVVAPLVRNQVSAVVETSSPKSPVLLSYEVVRKNPEAMEKLVNKMKRFLALKNDWLYPVKNYHEYAKDVIFVICGESEIHNREIQDYLKEQEELTGFNKFIFTDDIKVNQGDTRLYEIEEDGTITYYKLPLHEAQNEYAA